MEHNSTPANCGDTFYEIERDELGTEVARHLVESDRVRVLNNGSGYLVRISERTTVVLSIADMDRVPAEEVLFAKDER